MSGEAIFNEIYIKKNCFGPVSEKTAPKRNWSRAETRATNELFFILEPSQLCNHTFWTFSEKGESFKYCMFSFENSLTHQTWRFTDFYSMGRRADLDRTNEIEAAAKQLKGASTKLNVNNGLFTMVRKTAGQQINSHWRWLGFAPTHLDSLYLTSDEEMHVGGLVM